MEIPVFDSIINGALQPNRSAKLASSFNTISRALSQLPDNLFQAEKVMKEQLGDYVQFSFDDERAVYIGLDEEYHPVPQYKYPIVIHAFPAINDTPEHRFYSTIIASESKRIKMALFEFSAIAKADIDTKGEVKRTLERIYHLSLQLKNADIDQVIHYSLKQQMIQLYYEIAFTYNYLIPEDKIVTFEDYYYTLFDSYPTESISSLFLSERIKAEIQRLILFSDSDITLQKRLLGKSMAYAQLTPISLWLSNYIFTEIFAINTTANIDSERGSRDLFRFYTDQKSISFAKATSKSQLIAMIEADIEAIDNICEASSTSASSQARTWLYEQLHSAEAKSGSSSSDDFSLRDGLLYKDIATKVEQIKDLFDFLIRENKIDSKTEYINFKRVFSGNYATTPIKWVGDFSELMAMFRQMKADNIFSSNDKIWEKVCKSFVRKDGTQFYASQIASQHPSELHKSFAKKASALLTA